MDSNKFLGDMHEDSRGKNVDHPTVATLRLHGIAQDYMDENTANCNSGQPLDYLCDIAGFF